MLAVIHQILGHHRALESKWHAGKLRLHQKLALRLFQEDVKQVLDWLQNHGDVFLRKNRGIGKSLQKARIKNRHLGPIMCYVLIAAKNQNLLVNVPF